MSQNEDIPDLPGAPGAEAKLAARPSRARYDKVHAALLLKWRRRRLEPERMMREVADGLWDRFAASPYSWCGFYRLSPDESQLILGPHRDKPARSPLPLHGVCGRALRAGQSVIVPDLKALGQDEQVECDPGNLSKIAVPVFDRQGKAWAVFDVDSSARAAFDEMDQRWLERILKSFQDVERLAASPK